MNHPTMSSFSGVVFPLLLTTMLAGCWPSPITVPAGGQEVHVVVEGDKVHLEPTTVRSGDVYLILDNPGTNVVLVQRKTAPEETPGPLTDEELDRIAHGDSFHTSQTSGFANGEPYGNVSKLVLSPGKHAFLADAPELLAERSGGVIPPESMAVLQVLP